VFQQLGVPNDESGSGGPKNATQGVLLGQSLATWHC
jgi:hypothetical protein